MINEIEITLDDQLVAATEQAEFHLLLLKDDPTNEYTAKRFATWQAMILSLEKLRELLVEREQAAFKNF